jgi:hypothetical protein
MVRLHPVAPISVDTEMCLCYYSPVSQLVESLTVNQVVLGSSPSGRAISRVRLTVSHLLWEQGDGGSSPSLSTIYAHYAARGE